MPVAAITAGQAVLYGAILLVCLGVGGGAIHVLRKRLKDPNASASGPALTMTQLRKMRESGEISDKEYKALRNIVAAQYDNAPRPARTPKE